MSATGGAGASEEALRDALYAVEQWESASGKELLHAAITELVELRQDAAARAARAPVADDYPAEVFRELWRVLKELRAATGAEGRA